MQEKKSYDPLIENTLRHVGMFNYKGGIASWGNDQFWLFPNLSIQIWNRGYYITYTYWPEAVDSLMATLYHRVSVLQPELSEIGIGWVPFHLRLGSW